MTQPLPNPLLQIHEIAGAEFQSYDQTPIVSTFGRPEAEYAAIRKSAGLMDLPQRGILELAGPDRLTFLNNLLTNQVGDLAPGRGAYSFLLNGKGRIVTDMAVIELGDRTLLEMDARLIETVRQTLAKYLFRERVTVTGRVGQWHEFAIHGPNAASVVSQFASVSADDLPRYGSTSASVVGHHSIIWRDDPAGIPGYHIIIPSRGASAAWSELVERYVGPLGPTDSPVTIRSLRPVGWAAFNATRIEAGTPLFAVDFDESVLPAETGLLQRAVSFAKGCYLGQEIVGRMQSRAQLARLLVGIRMEDGRGGSSDALPLAGARIYDDQDQDLGEISSSTISPMLSGAAIALGYVKRPMFEAGTPLRIPADGATRPARVTATPFFPLHFSPVDLV